MDLRKRRKVTYTEDSDDSTSDPDHHKDQKEEDEPTSDSDHSKCHVNDDDDSDCDPDTDQRRMDCMDDDDDPEFIPQTPTTPSTGSFHRGRLAPPVASGQVSPPSVHHSTEEEDDINRRERVANDPNYGHHNYPENVRGVREVDHDDDIPIGAEAVFSDIEDACTPPPPPPRPRRLFVTYGNCTMEYSFPPGFIPNSPFFKLMASNDEDESSFVECHELGRVRPLVPAPSPPPTSFSQPPAPHVPSQWPPDLQLIIDDPAWSPRFKWNLLVPHPEPPQQLDLWRPPLSGSDDEAVFQMIMMYTNYSGPREIFEDSQHYRRFRRENTDLTLGHRAMKPAAIVVRIGIRKLEVYFNREGLRFREGLGSKHNPVKCRRNNCWFFHLNDKSCTDHHHNDWNHSAVVCNVMNNFFACLTLPSPVPQSDPPIGNKWMERATRTFMQKCDLTVDDFHVIKRWKEVVNGSPSPVFRHSLKLGLLILHLIHNTNVDEDQRIIFPHDSFDCSKASLQHVLQFLTDNGVKFIKSAVTQRQQDTKLPFPTTSEYPIPNVYLATTHPGECYGGVNGNASSPLKLTGINPNHKPRTAISKAFYIVDDPSGIRVWQPKVTPAQEKVLRNIANKEKLTKRERKVWLALLPETLLIETLLHVAIELGEILGCQCDGFPIRSANVQIGTGHRYNPPHLDIMKAFFKYLTQETLEVEYNPRGEGPLPGGAYQPLSRLSMPQAIVWDGFQSLIDTTVIDYD